ncbi:MAG: hypothetical protein ACK42H_05090 [Planctomycetota bacterium]
MFMFSQPDIAMPLMKVSAFLITWAYPCLQIALVIGILLTMAAPKASGVAPWGIGCLLITMVTNLWPIVVYWWDLPMRWLGSMGIGIAPFAHVYSVNRLMSSKTDGSMGEDTSWSQIPRDTLRPTIVLPAVLALASYGAYQAAAHWLAPGYLQRQIAKMKLDFPSLSTEPAAPDKSIGTKSPNLKMKTLAGTL